MWWKGCGGQLVGLAAERFGLEAHKFVNAAEHRPLKLRGINARVVQAGICRSGEEIRVL